VSIFAFVSTSPCLYAQQANGKCDFKFINYPGAYYTYFFAVNNQGEVAGLWGNQVTLKYGFLWRDGVFSKVRVPGSRSTDAHGVNNFGDVVGAFSPEQNRLSLIGYIFSKGKYRIIPNPLSVRTYSYANSINDQGDILGFNGISDFVLHNGTFFYFSIPNSETNAMTINNRGWVVGYYTDSQQIVHGFLMKDYRTGEFVTIDYPGGSFTELNAINDAGTMLGVWADDQGYGGTFRLQNGSFEQLPTTLYPTGINNSGLIVGWEDDGYKPNRGMIGHCK